MKTMLCPLLIAAALAGCGSSVASLSSPVPASAGPTLSGTLGDAVQGSVVRAYLINSGGVLGEVADSARSFPVPPPEPVAVSSPTGEDGKFSLHLPGPGPYLLKATGGRYRDPVTGMMRTLDEVSGIEAVVDDTPAGPVRITAWSGAAARLALTRARAGHPVEQAVSQANSALARHLALDNLLRPQTPGAQANLRLVNGAVSQMAHDQGLDPSSLRQALARDLGDGRFDGTDSGTPIPVLRASAVTGQQDGATATNLSPAAGTSDLAAATLTYQNGAGAGDTASEGLQTSLGSSDGTVTGDSPGYVSPYSVAFGFPLESLTADFQESPRNAVSLESDSPPFAQWYTVASYPAGQLPWGPLPATFTAPLVPASVDPVTWKRERVVATGLRYIGYDYQHHHIPDWNPEPYNWPAWLPVLVGHNGAGIDCSDFSSWNYNAGLGLKLITNVAEQAAATEVGGVPIQTIAQVTSSDPTDYAGLVSSLKTGDLLYIRGNAASAPGTGITHVIMWVGEIGRGPDSTPLILDSHDNQPLVKDANGNVIPPGVHLRPFLEGSWYHRAFDHAHRLII